MADKRGGLGRSHQRVGAAVIGLVLVWLAVSAAGGDRPRDADGRAGFEHGPLSAVAPTLRELLQLSIQGDRLRLDRSDWEKPYQAKAPSGEGTAKKPADEELVPGWPRGPAGVRIARQAIGALGSGTKADVLWRRIISAVGPCGMSSSTGGTGERQVSFTAQTLSGSLWAGADAVRVSFQEETGPGRALRLWTDAEGGLRIIVFSPDSGLLLSLNQAASGKVTVLYLNGERVVRNAAASFLAYYGANRRLVEDEVLPLLEHVGIGMALGPGDPRVAQAVLARLRQPSLADDAARARRLIDQLADSSFAERQKASEELAANYPRFCAQIDEAVKQESGPPEVLERLKKIIAENEHRARVEKLISSLRLLDDVEYLVRLLETAGAEDRELLARRLEQITGRKLGSDPARWKGHLTTRPAPKATRPVSGEQPTQRYRPGRNDE